MCYKVSSSSIMLSYVAKRPAYLLTTNVLALLKHNGFYFQNFPSRPAQPTTPNAHAPDAAVSYYIIIYFSSSFRLVYQKHCDAMRVIRGSDRTKSVLCACIVFVFIYLHKFYQFRWNWFPCNRQTLVIMCISICIRLLSLPFRPGALFMLRAFFKMRQRKSRCILMLL